MPMKMQSKSMRVWLALLLAALLCACCVSALADAKTLTVAADGTGDYATIQEAIDAVAAQTDATGWTINVKAGTYERFTVPYSPDLTGLTICGESVDNVIVNVLNDNETRFKYDGGGIVIWNKNVTLKNMTVVAGTRSKQKWYDAAITTNNGDVGGVNFSLTVENCVLKGPGIASDRAMYGIFWACSELNVKNCTISGFANAIELQNDNFNIPAVKTFEITGNTITGSSFAIHGYMGGGNGGGTLLIANNTITGTDALRSKVIAQDQRTDTFAVNIKNNNLTNAVVGLVNLQDAGDKNDILKENNFGKNCFYVEAIEPGTIDFYTTYYSPSGQYGHWKLTGLENFDADMGKDTNPENSTEYIQAAVDKANAEHSTKLSITGIDKENLVKTFTWFKDGIYWVTEDAPEVTPVPSVPSTPDIPKTGDETPLLGMALCALAAGAAVVILLRRRQRV